MNIREEVSKMKKIAPTVAALPLSVRDHALVLIREELNSRKEDIFAENETGEIKDNKNLNHQG